MKIVSIDVGIKNLSFCLFHKTESNTHFMIEKWDNIDLTEQNELKCIEVDKNGLCDKPAKYTKDNQCYCLKHSKKYNYILPTSELQPSFLHKQKIQKLIELCHTYKVNIDAPPKKSYLIELLTQFYNDHCYHMIEKTNASKIDLVTIGRNIQHKLDILLEEHVSTLHTIIIENQIGPIANKMKTIQGMLAQYFIMKNNHISIEFISATNKLKDFIKNLKEKEEKLDYKQRKKLGIQTCNEIISNDFRFQTWHSFFQKHNKKDDLSDCFLQGLWYLNHKL